MMCNHHGIVTTPSIIMWIALSRYKMVLLPFHVYNFTHIRYYSHIMSSSRTSVRVKLGLFNAKIRNENRRYIHKLMYQINEQDLLCHSI